MASRRLRIGIVGAGRFGRSRVLPQLQQVLGAQLVAVCNSTRESGERAAQQFGIERVLTDWRQLVALDEIDVVFNGTQAPLHHDVIIGALESGKHVLTMNPLATNAAEAREIVAKAREHPHLKTMLFPSFPLGPYMREDPLVRRLLAEGRIGRVLQVLDVWHTPFLALGSHFEVLSHWVGEHKRLLALRRAFEGGGQRRLAVNIVLAELASGALATYSHSTVVVPGAAAPRIEVHGQEGTIIIHYERPGMGESRGVPTVYMATAEDREPRPVPVPTDLQAAWDDPRVITAEAQFVAWVRDGVPPSPAIPTFEEGLKAAEFAEAFLASAQQGTWVELGGA